MIGRVARTDTVLPAQAIEMAEPRGNLIQMQTIVDPREDQIIESQEEDDLAERNLVDND